MSLLGTTRSNIMKSLPTSIFAPSGVKSGGRSRVSGKPGERQYRLVEPSCDLMLCNQALHSLVPSSHASLLLLLCKPVFHSIQTGKACR